MSISLDIYIYICIIYIYIYNSFSQKWRQVFTLEVKRIFLEKKWSDLKSDPGYAYSIGLVYLEYYSSKVKAYSSTLADLSALDLKSKHK